MQSVIEIMKNALDCELSANRSTKLRECAVYDWYTTSWDGIKRGIMLKVTIYAESMNRALELQEQLERALVTFGDRRLTETAISCVENGGGWMTDGERHCRIAYFEITIRDANAKGD